MATVNRNGSRKMWAALAAGAFAAAAGGQTPTAPAAGGGLRTFITMETVTREVYLLGRSGPDVLYRTPNAPAGVSATIKPDGIQRAEFDIKVDERVAYAFARRREWISAAQTILPAIQPTLPFLDLPDNNAAEWAMAAGLYLRKAAQTSARGDARARADAPRLFAAAQTVLTAAGRASWHYFGEVARIRAILCQIDLGRLDDAAKELARIREPEKGDATYGAYWLAQGELLFARKKYPEAMDAAIRSLIYETKDAETFPDALILSARCYEEMNEMHRTRDIYYEVARLFRGTDWGDLSRVRLRRIMKDDLAAEEEDPDIAAVFFGSAEDMKESITQFLAASEQDKEVDVDAPKQEMGAEATTEGAQP
mgnify:CR=1 FL=1